MSGGDEQTGLSASDIDAIARRVAELLHEPQGPDPADLFAGRFRRALDEKDISVRQLAHRYNLNSPDSSGRPYLQKLLVGKHRPRLRTRRKIALAMGLPSDYFEGDDKEPEDEVDAGVEVAA